MELGKTIRDEAIEISALAREQHCYAIGKTGTGKSTLLRNMIAQDMQAGEAVVLIDPHGDLSRDVITDIPKGHDDDLIYLEPAYLPASVSFNLLDSVPPDDRGRVAGDIVAAWVSIFGERAVADRSQMLLRNGLLALMEHTDPTLLSVIRLLRDDDYRDSVIDNVRDPLVWSYWFQEFAGYDDKFREQVTAPILNKFDAFFAYPAIRHVLSQPENRVNLKRVIEDRKILIINVGGLGDGADRVFGALAVSSLWSAVRAANRTPVRFYIDEFQRFVTPAIADILSEARKFKLSLTLGHQFWGQVPDEIKHAVFGNVGTLISFGIGALDAPLIAKQFDLSELQLRDLKDHFAYVRGKPPSDSTLIETFPPPESVRKSPDSLIANSLSHFAQPRKMVEEHVRSQFPH